MAAINREREDEWKNASEGRDKWERGNRVVRVISR